MKFSPYWRGIHWPHVLFFTLTPPLAITGTVWLMQNGGVPATTWVLALILFVMIGISVTGGYHRLFSHKSYRAPWPVRFLFLLLSAGAFQGSARWWSCGHRFHHRYEDQSLDPYNIKRGFWHAHIGWLFTKDQDPPSFDNVRDLDQDPLVRLQDRFFIPLSVLMGFVFPTALASLWGDPWGGLFVAGLLRMVLNHHTTFCINSFCHFVGKQTYSDQKTARDSWITALVTFGEGYHNFHHVFPNDYRNGIRAYQFDPTKWMIRLLSLIRLATDLTRAHRERILATRLAMDQKRVSGWLADHSEAARVRALEILGSTRTRLEQAYAQFMTLKEEYRNLKQAKIHSMNVSLKEMKLDLRHSRQDFKEALSQWRSLIQGQAWIPLNS